MKKCATMHFSTSNRKQKYEYKMKGEILETVSQHPYLGVELSDNLKFNDHICALWSPAGKGLTSWLSFVESTVSLSLSHWYPGSGVVLDCIDS